MIKQMEFLVTNKGYLLRYMPNHKRAETKNAYSGYVYEHIVVAEKELGRPLRKDEVVHHFDENKVNNSPANLLVLPASQHAKLHRVMGSALTGDADKEKFSYKDNDRIEYILSLCARCRMCKMPFSGGRHLFCSDACMRKYNLHHVYGKDIRKPSIEEIIEVVQGKSWEHAGRVFGVSGNAVKKWVSKNGINPKDIRSRTAKVAEWSNAPVL